MKKTAIRKRVSEHPERLVLTLKFLRYAAWWLPYFMIGVMGGSVGLIVTAVAYLPGLGIHLSYLDVERQRRVTLWKTYIADYRYARRKLHRYQSR